MPTAGALRRPIWIVSGLRRISSASLAITGGMVAENSSVCSRAGRRAMIRLRSGRKPMSSMRSASSRTSVCSWSKRAWFCRMWSSSRPGVATSSSTPARSAFSCGPIGVPPTRRPTRSVGVVGQAQADVVDLLGQLARGRDDQRLRRAARQVQELVQDRQQEGGRLAGAGLGGGDEVAAGEDGGDGLRPGWASARV